MQMSLAYREYRKKSGMAKFERDCRVVANTTGRLAKAYKVPGTREHGEYCMFLRRWNDTKDHGEKMYMH